MHIDTLKQRVKEAHEQSQPLRLRGAGTKDFYGESISGEPLDLSIVTFSTVTVA